MQSTPSENSEQKGESENIDALTDEFYGVESEDIDSEAVPSSSEPYDPNQIRVRLWTPSLSLLLERLREEEIDLTADFQRKAGIWKDKAQSKLIESLLLRIPMPAFYMDGQTEDNFVVIDGIQRLTALKRFVINQELKLVGLEFLKEMEGKRYDELPRTLKRRIKETETAVYVVERGTPIEAKLNIFKRINTGGLSLTPQEIRHAMNPGPIRGYLKELADLRVFKEATAWSIRSSRMDDREMVARFLAFYALGVPTYAQYYRDDLDAFINAGMHKLNETGHEGDKLRSECRVAFERSMSAACKIFKNDAFRKRFRHDANRKVVNKPLFEAWSVNLSALTEAQLTHLIEHRDDVIDGFIALMNTVEFERSVSVGTGSASRVKHRFESIDGLIRDVLSREGGIGDDSGLQS